MGLVIESTTVQATKIPVGSGLVAEVNTPTGVALGDLLVIVLFTEFGEVAPAGWTEEATVEVVNNLSQSVYWKIATATEVAASTFDFTGASSVGDDYWYKCYRITGATTSSSPFLYKLDDSITAGSTTPVTDTISLACTNDSLIIYTIMTAQGTDDTNINTPTITGVTVTMASATQAALNSDERGYMADGIVTAGSEITGYGFSLDSDYVSDRSHYINILVLPAQQDASTTPTFTTTGNIALAPVSRAGANATPTFAETTNEGFEPGGYANTKTNWSNDANPEETSWTNDTI